MRCKICGTTGTPKQRCWREWGLCGICGVSTHPEEYPSNLRTRQKGVEFTPNYKFCNKCNNPIYRLKFSAKHTTISIDVFYCNICRLVYNLDKKITINQGVLTV